MNCETSINLTDYNNFCKSLHEGSILFNIDKTNYWGDYFLVANIATVVFKGIKTYSMLLLGLRKKGKDFVSRNCRIKITPEYAKNIPFLKYVGYCNFTLIPEIKDINVNLGLATVYGEMDLHKYAKKLSIRKPQYHKYGKDGKPVIKKMKNE